MAKGATGLTDAELTAMLVGMSVWLRNDVTNAPFKVRFDTEGNMLTLHIGRDAQLPSEVGPQPTLDYQTVPVPYSIKNGRVVTMLANTPFEMAFYKLDDHYYGARSNEFGYANYEVLAEPPANLVDLREGERTEQDQSAYLHTTE